MSQEILDFISVWGFVISVFGFVITIILLAFNLFLIRGQLKVAKTQNETQIEIAKEQFKTQREIAERQFKIEVLSRNRQEWINKLREEIAQWDKAFSNLGMAAGRNGNMDEYYKMLDEMTLRTSRIQLMLNPGEELHADLLKRMFTLQQNLVNFTADIQNKEAVDEDKLIALASDRDPMRRGVQAILKSEWERVKRGE